MRNLASIRVIAEARYPSLALRGLVPLSEKDVPAVPIVYMEDSEIGGMYHRPVRRECQIGQRFYDLRRGLILLSLLSCSDFEISDNYDYEATGLAHEWRHHWQHWHGYESDSLGWPPPGAFDSYNQQIREFYTQSYTEMDALLFSWRVTGKIEDYVEEAIWGGTS